MKAYIKTENELTNPEGDYYSLNEIRKLQPSYILCNTMEMARKWNPQTDSIRIWQKEILPYR